MNIIQARIVFLIAVLLTAACGGADAPAAPAADAPPAPGGPGWSVGPPMLSERSEMPAVALDGRIYVPGGFGGTQFLEAYDPGANLWSRLADMPAGRHHLMAVGYEGQLYVFGGSPPLSFGATRTAWSYDPAADAWSELEDMPEAVTAGAAVALDDRIFVVGGAGSAAGGEMLIFDPQTGDWKTETGPASPREHLAAVAYGGRLWVLGGRWGGIGEQATVEIYDPSSRAWSAGPAMKAARSGFGAAVVEDTIVAAGGELIFTDRHTIETAEIFDPESGEWTFVPDLPFPVHGVGAAALDGVFYLPGGSDQAASIANAGRMQIYRP